MNSTNIRHTAASLASATATAVAGALTIVSAIAPTPASAHRDSAPAPARSAVATAVTDDIGLQVAYRKTLMAQYYVDHAREPYQRAAH